MFRFMAQRSARVIPVDLRERLETARLDLLALFRALDHMDLSATEIFPQPLPDFGKTFPGGRIPH